MSRYVEVDWNEQDVIHVAPMHGPEHDCGDDASCWCSPEVEKVPRDDGTHGLLVKHRSMN